MKLPEYGKRGVETLASPLNTLGQELKATATDITPVAEFGLKFLQGKADDEAARGASEALTRYSQFASEAVNTYAIHAEHGTLTDKDAKDV